MQMLGFRLLQSLSGYINLYFDSSLTWSSGVTQLLNHILTGSVAINTYIPVLRSELVFPGIDRGLIGMIFLLKDRTILYLIPLI